MARFKIRRDGKVWLLTDRQRGRTVRCRSLREAVARMDARLAIGGGRV